MPFSPRGIEQSLVLPPRWPLILYTGTLYRDKFLTHGHKHVGGSRARTHGLVILNPELFHWTARAFRWANQGRMLKSVSLTFEC